MKCVFWGGEFFRCSEGLSSAGGSRGIKIHRPRPEICSYLLKEPQTLHYIQVQLGLQLWDQPERSSRDTAEPCWDPECEDQYGLVNRVLALVSSCRSLYSREEITDSHLKGHSSPVVPLSSTRGSSRAQTAVLEETTGMWTWTYCVPVSMVTV